MGRIRNVIAFALESTTTLRMHVHPSSRCTERVPNAVIGSRGSLPHPPPAAQQAQPPAQRSWAARRLRGCAARLLCAAGSAEDSWLRKGSCAAEYPVLTDRFSFPRQSELSSAPRTGEAESRTPKNILQTRARSSSCGHQKKRLPCCNVFVVFQSGRALPHST